MLLYGKYSDKSVLMITNWDKYPFCDWCADVLMWEIFSNISFFTNRNKSGKCSLLLKNAYQYLFWEIFSEFQSVRKIFN